MSDYKYHILCVNIHIMQANILDAKKGVSKNYGEYSCKYGCKHNIT